MRRSRSEWERRSKREEKWDGRGTRSWQVGGRRGSNRPRRSGKQWASLSRTHTHTCCQAVPTMQLSAATQAQHHFFLHLCEFVGLFLQSTQSKLHLLLLRRWQTSVSWCWLCFSFCWSNWILHTNVAKRGDGECHITQIASHDHEEKRKGAKEWVRIQAFIQ